MPASTPNRTTVCFGEYELDLEVRTLRKNGIRLRCQEQPLQILTALAERPGELVTREELRRRVWPQDTFVDFDHALNTAVKKIRAALNDDADAPRYIETVPRRGYRFVAPVELKTLPPALPAVPAKANRGHLLSILGAAALVLGALGFAWKALSWRSAGSSRQPEFQRLTFDLPELGEARFTPDGASVVYTAARPSAKPDIYTQRIGDTSPQPLGLTNSTLLGVSRQGELAILSKSLGYPFDTSYHKQAGVLARVSLGGGGPRELLSDVEAAEWSPDGQLAVVRRVGHKSRLEFPVGKVLYETSGWIASPRLSPDGNSIAFLDHPIFPDDRGSVAIVDLNGAKRTLSGFWESVRGLAWSARGDELWFAATRSGVSRTLYAVNVSGRERLVWSAAGGLLLQDISRDGRVLLARDNERLGIVYMGPDQKEPRELSWKDWSIAMDLSADGRQILFGEEGENSGFSYQVDLRPTDGSPPVVLGSGSAQSLSPDGQWALSVIPPPNDQMVLLPTGAGTPRTLERGSVEHYGFAAAKWFPDGRRIVFAGYEPGHGSRCYTQSVESGKPRAFTPDGMLLCGVSPQGRILALTENRLAMLYASDSSGKPEKEFQLDPGDVPSGWTPDGEYLYLSETRQSPVSILKLELASGRRLPWKQLPALPTGTQMKSEGVIVTPDGQSYAYTYSRHLSDLYVVVGLR
jgi:DNA-binding winged helix-turn-helix (wHTH) protein/Tol biopolymer transport system component